jgi:hypothetical protein
MYSNLPGLMVAMISSGCLFVNGLAYISRRTNAQGVVFKPKTSEHNTTQQIISVSTFIGWFLFHNRSKK